MNKLISYNTLRKIVGFFSMSRLTPIQAIDEGRKRTEQQVLSMASGEMVSSFATAVTKEMFAGGLHFSTGKRRPQPLRVELIEFYQDHREAIQKSVEHFTNKRSGTAKAYVVAAIARASYHVPKKKLERFADIIAEGYSKEGEEVAVAYRNYLLRKLRESKHTSELRDDLYARAEAAIRMFVKGDEGKIVPAAVELYPLPKDEQIITRYIGEQNGETIEA